MSYMKALIVNKDRKVGLTTPQKEIKALILRVEEAPE